MLDITTGDDMGRRAGRKRKAGKREPNGKPQRTALDLKTRTSRQPHRRALKGEDRFDFRAESALGRLFLRGRIDNDGYDAGSRYAHVVGEYRATILAPRTTSGSGRGVDCLAEITGTHAACRFDPDNCRCFRRKARYDALFEALARAGRRALMAVNRVAVQGEDPTEEEIVYLDHGLHALECELGLTAGRSGRNVRNAH